MINILNARVLIKNLNSYKIENHNLLVDAGKIVAIDVSVDGAQIFDNAGDILLPMFFNAHCHLGETVFKNLPRKNWTLTDYLHYTENHNKKLSEIERCEEWTKSACETITLQKKFGIIGFCAARSAEISARFAMENMAGYPIMNSDKLKAYKISGVEGFKKYFEKYSDSTCSVGVFFHSLYMNDLDSLLLAKKCMDCGGKFFSVHVAEDEETANLERKNFGKSPIKVLDENGLLNEKTLLVHGTLLSNEELNLIAERNAIIVLCPLSNNFFGTKILNPATLDEKGITWFTATDGLATGQTFSLLAQCKFLKEVYPQISYENLFASITERPADFYGSKNYTGRIEAGVRAHFIKFPFDGENLKIFWRQLFQTKENLNCIAFD